MKFIISMTVALSTISGAAFANGAQLFKERACWACHGKDGKTTLLPNYPKIAGQNAQYVERQIQDIKSGARSNANSEAMRGILPRVSDAEIKELAEFVSKLKP